MRLVGWCLVLGACHSSRLTLPIPDHGFIGRLDGQPLRLQGTAQYTNCQEQYHVFLVTREDPKSAITLHPMGVAGTGRHPIAKGSTIRVSPNRAPQDSLRGPFYATAALFRGPAVDADSGVVDLFLTPDHQLRGVVELWLGRRRLTASFLASRNASLERGLTDVTGCSR